MRLFASSVNRSDVDDLFRGRVRKTSPCKTEQAKHNQDDPNRSIHAVSFGGGSYLQPPLVKRIAIRYPIPGEMGFCDESSEIGSSALLML